MHEVSDEWCKFNVYTFEPRNGDDRPNKLKITQVIRQSKAMGDTMNEIPNPSLSKQPRRGYQEHNHLDPCLWTY